MFSWLPHTVVMKARTQICSDEGALPRLYKGGQNASEFGFTRANRERFSLGLRCPSMSVGRANARPKCPRDGSLWRRLSNRVAKYVLHTAFRALI